MSPEPMNRCVSDSPQNLPINQPLSETKCLNAMKSTSRVTKLRNDSNKPSGLIPRLPVPEPRSVAGHVSRERNRVSMAEAAPSNSSRRSSKQQQQSQRQQRRQSRRHASNNNHDGSDSDSEHNDSGSDKNPGQARRRRIQNQENEAMDEINSAALLKEEKERVRLLQTLTKVGSEWERMRLLRQHNQESGGQRVKRLIRRYGNDMRSGAGTEMTSRTMDKLAVLDKERQRRQEYFDDALCRHLEGNKQTTDDGGSVETPDHLEELIQRTELGIIRRCRPVDPYARSWDVMPPKAQFRLVRIVEGLYSATWNYLSAQSPNPERSYTDNLVDSCKFIEEKCPKDDRKGDRKSDHIRLELETMIVDPVIDSYFAGMTEELSEDVVLDFQKGRRRQDLGTLRVCEKIHNSRHNDHLTPEYSTWASSRLDAEQKDATLFEWNRKKQQEVLADFRRLMDSAKMNIRQEFCSDIITPGVVSLVLFKEDWPSAVKDVAPDELRNMGWVLEEQRYGNQFVRLDVRRDPQERREHIFKVSMEDEVLAILGADGRQWIYWDEKEFARQRNERRRLLLS